MEPFRFVHAARLLLDHQLHETGPLPESIRQIVEDATLLAWGRVVETCLAERADLLLLAGDSFDQADQSVRGPAALVRGFERLAEHGVTVVVAPGRHDPWDAWPTAIRMPPNVLRMNGADEIPIVRDDVALAIVHGGSDREPATETGPRLLRMSADMSRPLEIHLMSDDREIDASHSSKSESIGASPLAPFEYVATGGGGGSRTIVLGGQVIHDPGPCQAIRARENGPRGCTLVAVDSQRVCRRTFVPTAPVRFEQLGITVESGQTRDDLVREMIRALERLPRHDSDRVWLVAWNVFGRGAGLEMLGDETTRRELLEFVHADHGIDGMRIQTQDVRIHPSAAHSESADVSDELSREFVRRFDARTALPQSVLERCLSESRLHSGPWEDRLGTLLAELDAGEIVAAARRRGMQWVAEEDAPS